MRVVVRDSTRRLQVEVQADEVLSHRRTTSVSILFSTVENALMLLQYAYQLPLDLDVCLLVAQPAPYPAQLVSPSMLASFTIRYFKAFVAGHRTIKISTVVHPGTRSDIGEYLAPKSILLFAGPQHWWPSAEQRLAHKLSECGHEIVFVPTSLFPHLCSHK